MTDCAQCAQGTVKFDGTAWSDDDNDGAVVSCVTACVVCHAHTTTLGEPAQHPYMRACDSASQLRKHA